MSRVATWVLTWLVVPLVAAIVAEVLLATLRKVRSRMPFQIAKVARVLLSPELRELVYVAEWEPELQHILTESEGGALRRFWEALKYAVALPFGVPRVRREMGAPPMGAALRRLLQAIGAAVSRPSRHRESGDLPAVSNDDPRYVSDQQRRDSATTVVTFQDSGSVLALPGAGVARSIVDGIIFIRGTTRSGETSD